MRRAAQCEVAPLHHRTWHGTDMQPATTVASGRHSDHLRLSADTRLADKALTIYERIEKTAVRGQIVGQLLSLLTTPSLGHIPGDTLYARVQIVFGTGQVICKKTAYTTILGCF